MTKFVDSLYFETEICCNCGMAFAILADFQRRRIDDHKTFYCPAGHGQSYKGPTQAMKLRDELERKKQMLEAETARAQKMQDERDRVARAHHKMRTRVVNGVCPCCNRSFGNLRDHMKTEHPNFGAVQTISALRQAFGMTQADVAREAGVNTSYVSLYERDKPVAGYAKQRLDNWTTAHAGKE